MKALCEASPQARHHFTRFDQVDQLVRAALADPDTGFMARLMMLCSLPRTDPGDRNQYKRVNGPFTLIMTPAGHGSDRGWQPGRTHAAVQPDEAALQRAYPAGL